MELITYLFKQFACVSAKNRSSFGRIPYSDTLIMSYNHISCTTNIYVATECISVEFVHLGGWADGTESITMIQDARVTVI